MAGTTATAVADRLDALADPGRDLLGRADRVLTDLGGPPGHGVWLLLNRLRLLPGEGLVFFLEQEPGKLRATAAQLRNIAATCVDVAEPLSRATRELAWGGPGYEAFSAHWVPLLGQLGADAGDPAGLVARLLATADHADRVAEWSADGRDQLARVLGAVLQSADAVVLRTCPVLSTPDGNLAQAAVQDGLGVSFAQLAGAAASIGEEVLGVIAELHDAGLEQLVGPEVADLAEPAAHRGSTSAGSATGTTWVEL